MDLHLPLLADINFHLGVAEEASKDGSWSTVSNNLEKAEESFSQLRDIYPSLGKTEKGLMAAIIKPLKARYDEIERRVPKLQVISEGTPEPDAEEDDAPED